MRSPKLQLPCESTAPPEWVKSTAIFSANRFFPVWGSHHNADDVPQFLKSGKKHHGKFYLAIELCCMECEILRLKICAGFLSHHPSCWVLTGARSASACIYMTSSPKGFFPHRILVRWPPSIVGARMLPSPRCRKSQQYTDIPPPPLPERSRV